MGSRARVGKPNLSLMNFWKLSVDNLIVKNTRCRGVPQTLVLYQKLYQVLILHLGEKYLLVPVGGEEKEPF